MYYHVFQFIHRNRRAVTLVLVMLVVSGVLAGIRPWATSGGPPIDVVTTLTDRCRSDPAQIPAAPAGANDYLHTCSSRIYDGHGNQFHVVGVSWFGLETDGKSPDGLWARNWQTILDQLAQLGYNTIRLPYSNDILAPGAMPSGINYLLNPDLQGLTSLQLMDKLIDGARQRGLRVLLDRHRPTSSGQSELWYTKDLPESKWIADWVFLANRYANDDTVIGADLHNEPRGPATWGSNDPATDWRLAAQRAGNAILTANPRWLIFVEGVQKDGADWYWWGGNLQGVARVPVILNVPNRVVYSPHDYGPEVYPQGWFKDPTFPANLPSVWDAHWGFIAQKGIAPVVLGEFGGRSVGSDPAGQWQNALVRYLQSQRLGYVSWALNPDSGDTGGILQDDWLTVQSAKQSLYTQGTTPPPTSASNGAGASSRIRLTYHAASSTQSTPNAAFIVSLFNSGSQPVDLSNLSLRYWFAGDPSLVQATVDWALIGESHVTVNVIPQACGSQSGYLELRFDSGSGPIVGYGTTGPILVRYHRSDWGPVDPSRDYSYGSSTTDQAWTKIQIVRDAGIIWGQALSC
jgi:endoglucanase